MALRLPEELSEEMATKIIDMRQSRYERLFQMGIVALLTGDAQQKPGSIVVLVIVAAFATIMTLLLISNLDPSVSRKDIILSMVSLITLGMGYVFGRGGLH